MSIAKRLDKYLNSADVKYEVISHPITENSSMTAEAADIKGDDLAKAVVFHDNDGYVVAVVPSTHRVEVNSLQRILGRDLNLVTELELDMLFADCEVGAVPPLAQAYGLPVVLDRSLQGHDKLYFEAGDHRTLIGVNGESFAKLMDGSEIGSFSHHT
ncbi:MAG: aminoacyl-tRNA deacylase [Rhodospirillales bacterium]|nr:aminoacyl-tRNA deacylase [Rhodospirillales bacterium]